MKLIEGQYVFEKPIKPNECIGCCGEHYWDEGEPTLMYSRCCECINYTKKKEHHSYYFKELGRD